MRFTAALLLGCLVCSALAGEAQPPPRIPAPADAKATDAKTGPKPYLGVKIDESVFDGTNGLPVEQVVVGSTAADLDIRKGDRLMSLNNKKLTSKDDLSRILGECKVGDEIELVVSRNGEAKPLIKKGKLAERLRHETIWEILNKQRADLRELKAMAETKGAKPLSLPEILDRLKDIEKALPGAIADFKKQYPNGEFSFSLHIDIVSDRTAENPATISNKVDGAVK